MKRTKRILHFNVDKNLKKHLKGEHYSFAMHRDLVKKIPGKEEVEFVSLSSFSDVNNTSLDFFPNLKLAITRSVGLDHIDFDSCKKRGIAVYNIPDYGAYNIAEHALSLLLAGAHNIVQAVKYTKAGKYGFENLLNVGLKGKTLGVIGTGKIGLAFIKLVKGLDLKVLAFDVYKNENAAKELGFTYVSLDNLLKASDFISLHVPLIKQTHHLIGESEIKKMKKGAILVNTARGGVIDTKALIKNIEKFKAVCLDVLEDEANFSKNHPLLRFGNIIITPHIAFYSDDSIKKIAAETERNLNKFLKGDKTGRVI